MRFFLTFDWAGCSLRVLACDMSAVEHEMACVHPWLESQNGRVMRMHSEALRELGAELHRHLRSIRDGGYVLHEEDTGPFPKIAHTEKIEVDVVWEDRPRKPSPAKRWEFR